MSYVKYDPVELHDLLMKSYSEFDDYIRNHRIFLRRCSKIRDRIVRGTLIDINFLFEVKPLKNYFYQNDQYYRTYKKFCELITTSEHCIIKDIVVHLSLEDLYFILRWREKL